MFSGTFEQASAERPNILLFTADDLHAESLGVYGGRPTDLTPNLDSFERLSLPEVPLYHLRQIQPRSCPNIEQPVA